MSIEFISRKVTQKSKLEWRILGKEAQQNSKYCFTLTKKSQMTLSIFLSRFFAGILIAGISISFPTAVQGQNKQKKEIISRPIFPAFTPAEERLSNEKVRARLAEVSNTAKVPYTNIGPRIMSGRVVDLEVNPLDPTHFYVAYASGGVFVTKNNGQSFTPIFDGNSGITIGDIAVDWTNGETIWVGSGESNSSRSSYSGNGIYKSTDKGKSWQYLGLPESHHIGKIELHPKNPNVAWVAVVGHLYSYNQERGLYKTNDGGKTWKQSLYISPKAGAIDIVVDPTNPNILYCSTWERERKAWDFIGSGGGSGIFKSSDAGDTWELISRPGSGFPIGDHVGRIGLAISPQNPDILYAFLDNQGFEQELKMQDTSKITKDLLRKISKEGFLTLSTKKVESFLRDNNFPEKYKAADIFRLVKQDSILPVTLVQYLEDANARLFDTPIIGAELYRSNDGGKSWFKTHQDKLEGLYYTYGYYFGKMNVSPVNPDHVYLYGVDIVKSTDAGKTFSSILKENVHVDFHGLWINPLKPDHLIVANDGGLNMSYDNGNTWSKLNDPPVAQFYFINVDNAKPYNVYGGMQDNGTWYGPSSYKASNAWHSNGQYPYKELGGGDGMQVAIDTINNYVFYGYQFGHYFRKDTKNNKVEYITPKHALGERPYRWNWQTPVIVSRHNPAIVYIGSNHVHRSMDHGVHFAHKSKDLTTGGKAGNVPYGTLTTIDESYLRFGLLYTGSDDGLVHLSMDAGQSWSNITGNLPTSLWVSRIAASRHKEARVYLTLNGYRFDHFEPYIYVSEDYGKNWTSISSGLPMEPVNVIVEDPNNENILYVGTDNGLYITFDRGISYSLMLPDLPAVAVHDLKIQYRENDLLIGTHGRSIYKLNLNEIQQLNTGITQKPLYVFKAQKLNHNPSWGRKRQVWSEANESNFQLAVWVDQAQFGTIEVRFKEQLLKISEPYSLQKGLNYLPYNLSIDSVNIEKYTVLLNEDKTEDKEEITVKAADNGKYYLKPGKYELTIKTSLGHQDQCTLEIQEGKGAYRWGIKPSPREERKIKEFHWED
jgi:photosystem II stability/assembly factor-like uncharacterized protein